MKKRVLLGVILSMLVLVLGMSDIVYSMSGSDGITAGSTVAPEVFDSGQPDEFNGICPDGRVEAPEPVDLIVADSPLRPSESAPQSPGTITIKGTMVYVNENGGYSPMRNTMVYLMDDDSPLPDEYVATKWTDYNGYFSFTVNNDDGFLQGGRDPYVKVFSENGAAYCKTEGSLGGEYVCKLPKCGSDVPDGFSYNYGTRVPVSYNEAWQAIDACLSERDWVYWRSSPYWQRPTKVDVRWPTENWPHSHGNSIHLPRKSTRWWNHVTVHHEYAHCIMYALYGHFPSGWGPDPHYVDSESSLGFAMCEGWAEFMSCAVDGRGSNLGGTTENIETNDWYNHQSAGNMDGYKVEGSVASIFWDIYDGVSESDKDFLSWGFDEIFTVMRYNQPDNTDQFWTSWKARWPTISSSVGPLCTIYWHYGIDKDTYAPYYATIYINSATTYATNSRNQHLHIYCRDAGIGVAYMRLAASRTWSVDHWVYSWGSWQAYATYVSPWTLSAGDGTKYVYAQFKDSRGYVSAVYSDSIILDTVRPKVTGVSVDPTRIGWIRRISPPGWVYFGNHTHINFTLSEPCYVTIRIYNNQTNVLVRTLLGKNTPLPAGMNSVIWDGKYSNGTSVPNALYRIAIYVYDRAGNLASPYPIVAGYVTVYWPKIIIP